jgi:twinkle protein
MVKSVASRLGVAKCKKVILPYKDANESHVNGVSLHECIRLAKDITPEAFCKAIDKTADVLNVLEKGKRGEQGIPFMGWEGEDSIRFRLRPSEVTILAGREFSGKSTIGYQLFCYLMSLGKKCFIASLEEPIEEIFSVMLSQWFAIGVSISEGNDKETATLMFERTLGRFCFAYDDVTTTANLTKILESAEYSVKRYGVEFVMIDSLSATDVDMEDNNATASFIKEVVAFSKRTRAHIVLVTHCRKGISNELSRESIPTKSDIRGSVLLPALATNIITCWRNTLRDHILSGKGNSTAGGKYTKEEVEGWATTVLTVAKQKVSGVIGQYDLHFNNSCSRFRRSPYSYDLAYDVPNLND